MVNLASDTGKLVLEVLGTHKFWALRSRLEIPLEHIKGVHADPHPAMGWFQGLKIVGTDIPHLFRAGMFWQEGNKVFWDVRHPEKTIVIDVEDEGFAKLIVEVDDPEQAVQQIRKALAKHAALMAEAESELDEFLRSQAATSSQPEREEHQEERS